MQNNKVVPDEIESATPGGTGPFEVRAASEGGDHEVGNGGTGALAATPGGGERLEAPIVRNSTESNSKKVGGWAGPELALDPSRRSSLLAKEEAPLEIETAKTKTLDGRQVTVTGGKGEEEGTGCFMKEATLIFHPYSSSRLAWDIWIVFLLVYTSLFVPYALAFSDVVCTTDDAPIDYGAQVLLWSVDVCFWIDIFLNFRTAIIDPTADNLISVSLISDWKVITKSYLKGWFWLDVMGSFPVQVIEDMVLDGQCSLAALKALRLNRLARLARLLKLVRLARLARWGRLITKAKDALSINPGHLRLLQFILIVFVLAHFLSCFLYGIVDWEDQFAVNWATEVTIVVPGSGLFVLKCPPIQTVTDSMGEEVIAPESPTRFKETIRDGRLRNITECRHEDSDGGVYYLEEAVPLVKYLVSLYVTFTTLTTVGYGDITMKTTPELVFGIIMMAVGASIFAVVIGNMAALLGKMDIRASAFKERMEDLDDFMHQENLPLDLRFRTRAFFEYRYNHSRDIPASIEELSLTLRTEVALHLYNDLITTVPFFRDCGKEFLTDVILRLKAQTLSPGDFLYEAGEYGDSMFFLIKGSVEVVLDEKHGVFAELKEGSFFGEHCVLGLSEHRPVSVRAMTWCNLFCLTQQSLEDCICTHPEAQEHFRRLAYQQSAEKTVTSAVRNIDVGGQPVEPGLLDTGASAGASPGAADVTNIEPPVVTRALMRAKKGNGPGDKKSLGAGVMAGQDSVTKNMLGGEPSPAPWDAKSFEKEMMTNVAAAQRQSHAMRMQLRADLDKLYSQLTTVSKEDT